MRWALSYGELYLAAALVLVALDGCSSKADDGSTAAGSGGTSSNTGAGMMISSTGTMAPCTPENVATACGKDTTCKKFTCLNGLCQPLKSMVGTACAENGGDACDSEGNCVKKQGSPCNAAAQCPGGNCVDGVCCDQKCSNGCEACSKALGATADGTCTMAAIANKDDAGACDDNNGLCDVGKKCTCSAAGVCKVKNGETVGDASKCASGLAISGVCASSNRLSVGGSHTCALSDGGNVRCWGSNTNGQLGYGNTNTIGDDEAPSKAGNIEVGAKVAVVAAGVFHTCVLTDMGKVRCWGSNSSGQLGYGHTNAIGDNETPVSAGDVDVGAKVVQLTAGLAHTCALSDAGAVRCWGSGFTGALGYANKSSIGDDEKPTVAGNVDVGAKVVQIVAGDSHNCALTEAGKVRCWGSNFKGQLGYGHTNVIGDDEKPSAAGDVDVGAKVVQLTAGGSATCALTEMGKVRCWGNNSSGQLGYGNQNAVGDDEKPSAAGDVDLGAKAVQVDLGLSHGCAVTDSRKVRCWGSGGYGKLGYGNLDPIGDNEPPSKAGDVDLGADVLRVFAGDNHSCALTTAGKVRCWGRGDQGALGYGNAKDIGDDEKPALAGDVMY
jgi:alpha-tubulin suppressor-like RCC1 family protein